MSDTNPTLALLRVHALLGEWERLVEAHRDGNGVVVIPSLINVCARLRQALEGT